MRSKAFSSVILGLLVAAFTLTVTTRQAHAYIDLGSGSLLLQTLLASLFASLFTLKLLWRKLTLQISRLMGRLRHTGPHSG